jgi:hypothetical protein
VKPSAIIAANVDLDALAADDLEYNYDVAGLAGGCPGEEGGPLGGGLLQCPLSAAVFGRRSITWYGS